MDPWNKRSWVLVLIVVGVLVGCAQPPDEEIRKAEEALATAEASGAETWAPEDLDKARDALKEAKAALKAEADKLGPFRDYEETTRLVAKVVSGSQDAAKRAETERAGAEAKLAETLAEFNSQLTVIDGNLEKLAECRRKPKGHKAESERLSALRESVNDPFAVLEASSSDEDLLQSIDRSESLADQLASLGADTIKAIEQFSC